MSLEHLIAKEKKVRSELDDFILFNEDQGLTDLAFAEEYKKGLQDHYQTYRQVHDDLLAQQGKDLHLETYPDYAAEIDKLRTRIKAIATEMRKIREEERSRRDKEYEQMRLEIEERRRRDEREDRIREEDRKRDAERLLNAEKDREERLDRQKQELQAKLDREEEERAARAARELEVAQLKARLEEDSKKKEVLAASSLISEIGLIEKSLKCIYDRKLEDLSDEEILEAKKGIQSTDQRRFKLIEKITRLCSIIPEHFEKKDEVLEKHSKLPESISDLHEKYVSQITKECSVRNVSDSNMRDSSSLNIDLKKFSGYNSPLDIYSFRTDFENLHAKRLRTALLPEFLKNNYLEGTALSLVKTMTDMEEIWKRLREAFGDTKILLNNKLKEVNKLGEIWKLKERSKIVEALSKLVFVMEELKQLAVKHSIENHLYYGGAILSLYKIIGNKDRDKFIELNVDSNLSEEARWQKLTEFLKFKLKIQQDLLVLEKPVPSNPKDDEKSAPRKEDEKTNKFPAGKGNNQQVHTSKTPDPKPCLLCGENGHVWTRNHNFKRVIQYFSCKMFAEMTPSDRFKLLKDKGLCYQCLSPGAPLDTAKHRTDCFSKYCCKHPSHSSQVKKKHVLVCEEHKNDNKDLLEEYKKKCILGLKEKDKLPDYAKNICFHNQLTVYHSEVPEPEVEVSTNGVNHFDQPDIKDKGIYLLQEIEIEGRIFQLFYDNGCGELTMTMAAILLLMEIGRARLMYPGPVDLIGVCEQTSTSPHGIYQISLPMFNGRNAVMTGLCVDQVTAEFPKYPLRGRVEDDIRKEFNASPDSSGIELPRLPKEVGGRTAIMIGAKYLCYCPRLIFQTSQGLGIYRSMFASPDGSRGTVGGPHPAFTAIEHEWHKTHVNFKVFQRYHAAVDLDTLVAEDPLHAKIGYDVFTGKSDVKQSMSVFEAIEDAGTVCSYRCPGCRTCQNCKKSKDVVDSTIVEDVEQDLVEKSVDVNVEEGECSASLPFIADPKVRLSPSNEDSATKIYKSVVRSLSRNPQSKEDAIRAEKKLHDAGFVEYLENLPEEQQKKIMNSAVKYFHVWRPVWNSNSVSTDCRIVFDASYSPRGEESINSILAKGRNGMNSLVQICIRWSVRRFGFHTDISKMYPSIKLKDDFWCYQLYKWHESLDVDAEPLIKVVMRLIYGVRPSGNQAEYAIREIARLCQEEYPRAADVIQNDTYVDDCASGEDTLELAMSSADQVEKVLKKVGFDLKGVTVSGADPPAELANADGISISSLGRRWFSKTDKISLNCGSMNFGKKLRGRKPPELNNIIPDEFKRAQCMGRVAEIHDLIGLAAPLVGNFKLDLRIIKGLDYEQMVPEEFRSLWKSNFEMIQDLGNLKWDRAIVPEDAVSLDIETIDTGDATVTLACTAIYARFRRKSGDYSCQLIFARTKLVPEGMTQPRAELFAATMNATAGHVVTLALGDLHKDRIKLTDSQVALHWISNDTRVYKPWVKNQVIEINRLADKQLWLYVKSGDMVADIGTRKGVTLKDIDSSSQWINGYDWMRLDKSEFPVKSVGDLKLDAQSVADLKKEYSKGDASDLVWLDILENKVKAVSHHSKTITKHLQARYEFSKYVLDPNKFRFRKAVRVLTLVMLFCKKFRQKYGRKVQNQPGQNVENHLSRLPSSFRGESFVVTVGQSYKVSKNVSIQCTPGMVIPLTDADINRALDYYFRKATLEVKNFVRKNVYQKISTEKDGILFYKGRILPSQAIGGRKRMSDVMTDLSDSTFCVPLTDVHSPLAYSIVNEVHWFESSASHSGVETVMRYVQKFTHIIDGRDLITKFRLACHRCRVLEKKALEVAMGALKDCNLNIAPAFFSVQVDICGPFSSYSNHNKRATVNIYLVVFCCCTTSAVSIKVMDDYSTSAFLLAFLRFSCHYGYPKFVLPDEGSQLVKGCKDMQLSFLDIQSHLNIEYGVQFETCPVGGHNMHGKVERKIRTVRESIEKKLQGHRLSILQWESLGDQIANEINNLPLGTVRNTPSLEDLDILTPNRLLLGRNNERSPSGPLLMTNDTSKMLQSNVDVFTVWFESWLISYVPRLMYQPKWFKTVRDMKVGDIVLFLKTDHEYSKQYQYGIVDSVEKGRDDRIRTVSVRYRNSNEKQDRKTRRAVRELVVVHHVDEIPIYEELAEASKTVFLGYSSCS